MYRYGLLKREINLIDGSSDKYKKETGKYRIVERMKMGILGYNIVSVEN